jgi:hypothetical protein
MMQLELETPTKARVNEVSVLSQKNRKPDEEPGAKLSLQALVGNDILSAFDGSLKGWLFTKDATPHSEKKPKQGTLDGVDIISDLPNLSPVGAHLKSLKWIAKLIGYRLRVLQGIGGSSDIVIDDCTLDNFKLGLQQGGTVLLKFDLESSDVSGKTWGLLAKLKSTEIEITLHAPSAVQVDIGDVTAAPKGEPDWPFAESFADAEVKKRRKAKPLEATDVFIEQHGAAQ